MSDILTRGAINIIREVKKMKKKIYLLLVLLVIPSTVFAKEQTKRQYRYYYVERIYSNDFYEKGKNDSEYPHLGESWRYQEKIQTSEEKPDEKEAIIMEEIPIIKYQNSQKVRYIIIDSIYSDSKLNLEEIEVYSKEQKIQYKIDCSNCSSDFFGKIQNTIRVYEYNYVSNGTKLILDLKDEYFPDDLTIQIYFGGATGKKGRFRVSVNNTDKISNINYQYQVNQSLVENMSHVQTLKEIKKEDRFEEEIQEAKGIHSLENARILEERTEYRYRIKEYQYYKEIRHYIDGYHEELKGLLKDSEDFIEVEQEKEQEQKPIIITEYIEKEVYIPTTITEYVEKEVFVPTIMTEYIEKEVPTTIIEYIEKEVLVPTEVIKYLEKKVPIIKESIQYQDKIIEKEIPVEKEKIIEKVIEKRHPRNYPQQYLSYLLAAVFLKKMSFFKG